MSVHGLSFRLCLISSTSPDHYPGFKVLSFNLVAEVMRIDCMCRNVLNFVNTLCPLSSDLWCRVPGLTAGMLVGAETKLIFVHLTDTVSDRNKYHENDGSAVHKDYQESGRPPPL